MGRTGGKACGQLVMCGRLLTMAMGACESVVGPGIRASVDYVRARAACAPSRYCLSPVQQVFSWRPPQADDEGGQQTQRALRTDLPGPGHPGATRDRHEGEATLDVGGRHGGPRAEPRGPLVLRHLDEHVDRPSNGPHYGAEAGADVHRAVGELLRAQHSWVVCRFVALVGDAVEHHLDRSLDDDLTLDARHVVSPFRMAGGRRVTGFGRVGGRLDVSCCRAPAAQCDRSRQQPPKVGHARVALRKE